MNINIINLVEILTRRTRLSITIIVATALLPAGRAHAGPPIVLQFTATAQNTLDDALYLNSPQLNKKPTLKLIVTQNWTGTYNNKRVGVWLSGSQWAIYNEDNSNMPIGASFNVLVSNQSVDASPMNSDGDLTFFSLEQKNPNAILLVTHLYNPYPNVGMYLDHNIGLYYYLNIKKWSVFNEDGSSALAAAYNLADETKNPNAFVLTTTADGGDGVYIDNPISNNNPNAVIFVTPVYGTYWDHPLGVNYSNSNAKWDIFNEDMTTMPAGQKFNVVIFSGTSK
jgi:hypothetical protein